MILRKRRRIGAAGHPLRPRVVLSGNHSPIGRVVHGLDRRSFLRAATAAAASGILDTTKCFIEGGLLLKGKRNREVKRR